MTTSYSLCYAGCIERKRSTCLAKRRMMQKRRWLPLLVFLLTLVSTGCSTSSATAVTNTNKIPVTSTPMPFPNAAQLDAYLTHLATNGVLSGAVLVARNGMQFSKGYGLADKDAHIPNTPQTRFRIGSITKQFTAM